MLNTVYQLVRPRQFEIIFEDVRLDQEHILFRPTHLSICNADQRYYQGTRARDVLERKLPMALIHEGIGRVIYDPTGTFHQGERVVMIPNLPVETDPYVAENYLPSSRFRGSSINGLMQEYISTSSDRLVRVPEEMDDFTAAFTEMVTVCYHVISRFDKIAHARRERLGVWGDGNMGYMTALLLKTRYPNSHISVFGVSDGKLSDFTFADETHLVSEKQKEMSLDHCFECVGGNGATGAIDQMIRMIRPEGTMSLSGVSEDPVPINTRMVLEKGLRVFGTSRSGREDFVGLMELYREHPRLLEYLGKLVGAVINVRDVSDITAAFETDMHKMMGKTIMVW